MGFEVPCVKPLERATCCCCNCTLKTGTLVFAWLGVVGASLEFVVGVIGLITFDPNSLPQHEEMPEGQQLSPEAYKQVFIIYVVVGAIVMISDGLLVYGAMKEITKILEVLVIMQLIWFIGSLCAIIYFGIGIIAMGVVVAVVYILTLLVCFGISLWIWMIIYSFYRQLEERDASDNAAMSGKFTDPQQEI